jgi:hypothetical protein
MGILFSGQKKTAQGGNWISTDNGESFSRYQRTPILDRSDQETMFRCAEFVDQKMASSGQPKAQ